VTEKGAYEQMSSEERASHARKRKKYRPGRGGPEMTMTRDEFYRRQGLTPPPIDERKAA
jgi:hypothetical protein